MMQVVNLLHLIKLIRLIHLNFFVVCTLLQILKQLSFRDISRSPTPSAPPFPDSTQPSSTFPQSPLNDPRLPILHLPSYEEAVNMD